MNARELGLDYEPPCKTGSQCTSKCEQCRYKHDCDKAEQPAQQRPQNCGTGYCSCIECVMEPAQQQEPVAWGMPSAGGGFVVDCITPEEHDRVEGGYTIPLYTSPQPASKPVAWRTKNATPPGGYVLFQQYPQAVAELGGEIEPLYTSPPASKPWVGLTDEEIDELDRKNYGFPQPVAWRGPFARAVEAKLKERNA